MVSSDEEKKANLEVLKALNKAIEEGPWEYNLFFKGIGKKLRDVRDRFQQELGLAEPADEELAAKKQAEQELAQGKFTTVYISLYQAEGNNLQKWSIVVNSLAGHGLTRPVYRNEEDVKAMIRTKNYKNNDAYVAVRVKTDDIYPPSVDKPLVDRLGHELLVLKDNAIRIDRILYFIHVSGHYSLSNGVLVKQNNSA